MKYLSTLALAAGLASVEAITLSKRTDGPLRVVQHDIQRRNVANPIKRDRNRRMKRQSKTITESLENEETLYFASVTLGTPPQTLKLSIDTGSSDLWTNVANSSLCESKGSPCAVSGTYNPNDSSTYKYINSEFNITYVDGSGSAGDYASDTLVIGGATITGQEFGLGFTSTSEEGLIGVGYALNEAIISEPGGQPYANVPVTMVQQGLINSEAYSLWLNDLEASTGSILFGGVNTDKYTGTLETLPIIKEDGVYAEFIIALTAVGMNGDSGSIATNVNSPALLDSGTSLIYLPNDIASAIFTATGATYDESQGAAFIDCSMANNDSSVDFTFTSPTISVALSQLVIVAGEEHGEDICILGIAPADGSTPVLGDTFLRSAYVVYDLSNNEISIAQTDFNSTTNNIMEITNGTSGVPGASAVANAITSVAVTGGGTIETGIPTVTETGSVSTSKSGAQPTAAPFMKYGAALAAVGAGVVYAL